MSLWDQWVNDPKATQVMADPRYIAATKNYGGSVHDILYKYGFVQGADPSGNASGTIGNYAYSVANLLKRGRETSDRHSINDLNAAGLEESGAAVGALNANNEDYKRNVAEATTAQTGELNALGQGYTSEVAGLFADAMATPTYTTPALPTPSIGGTAGAPAPGGREADRPGIQPNPWHIPTTTGAPASLVAKKLKIKPNYAARAL